jgi:hypothetical protein
MGDVLGGISNSCISILSKYTAEEQVPYMRSLRELTPGDRSHSLEKVQSGKMVLDETGIIRTKAAETAWCVLENSVSCDSAHRFFLGGITRESKTLSLVVLCTS